jgi:uncharacterized protein YjbI with pentapeptide repeats
VIEEILVKQFIGKYTLASVDSSHRTMYATPMTERGSEVSAPAMAATSVGINETWLAYGTETGVILQMGNLQYLAQMDDVGMVVATDDVTCASRFRWLAVDPMTPAANTTLEIWVDGRGWQPVRYGFTSDRPASFLVFPLAGAVSADAGSDFTFGRTTITPSLSTIQATKSAIEADLRWVDLSAADLSDVDLSGADLTGAILDGAKITGGKLRGAHLINASMSKTDLTGTSLYNAYFDGSDISAIIWGNGSSATGASFRGCTAVGAKIGSPVKADWSHAILIGSDFGKADLTNVDLSSANLVGCVLVGAILETTNLTSATLGGVKNSAAANLSYAYLSNVNFKRANCFGVTFAFSTFFGALTNLSETATLEQADFANAYLEGINLSGTTLRGSRFDGACLIGANFTGADLSPTSEGSTPTSLAGVCLQGAQFTQSKLAAVNFAECIVAFEQGSFNVRYCGPGTGPYPAPPDYLPMNHKTTSGLDETTLQPDTICPNGLTVMSNRYRGNSLRMMLTTSNPATEWIPLGCRQDS